MGPVMGQAISVNRSHSDYRVYWVHLGNRDDRVYLATVTRTRVILNLPTIGHGGSEEFASGTTSLPMADLLKTLSNLSRYAEIIQP